MSAVDTKGSTEKSSTEKSSTEKGSTEKISHPDKVGRLTSIEETINII